MKELTIELSPDFDAQGAIHSGNIVLQSMSIVVPDALGEELIKHLELVDTSEAGKFAGTVPAFKLINFIPALSFGVVGDVSVELTDVPDEPPAVITEAEKVVGTQAEGAVETTDAIIEPVVEPAPDENVATTDKTKAAKV